MAKSRVLLQVVLAKLKHGVQLNAFTLQAIIINEYSGESVHPIRSKVYNLILD